MCRAASVRLRAPSLVSTLLTWCAAVLRAALAQWTTADGLRFPFTSNLVIAEPG
jgi:hypothetical protein